jgi:alkylation response protein AidB-like acyl-CoA dehydrogenase
MFSLALTDEQEGLRRLVAEIAERFVRPAADESDRTSGAAGGVLHRLQALGVVGAVSEESGGQGRLNNLETVLVTEELAGADPGIAWAAMASGWVLSTIDVIGGSSHRPGLRPIASNPGWLAAPLVMEGFGRSPQEFRAHARRSRGNWRLEGVKDPVVHGVSAGIGLAIARVEDTGVLGAFLLDAGALALCEVLRDDVAVGTLGLRPARTACLDLSDVTVNESCLLGWGDEVARAVAGFRLMAVAVAVGLTRAAVGHAASSLSERFTVASEIDLPTVRPQLIDLVAELEVARLALWEAAVALDDAAAVGWGQLVEDALAQAGRLASWAGREGMRGSGAHSPAIDHRVERWSRDAVALCVSDPGLSPLRSLSI